MDKETALMIANAFLAGAKSPHVAMSAWYGFTETPSHFEFGLADKESPNHGPIPGEAAIVVKKCDGTVSSDWGEEPVDTPERRQRARVNNLLMYPEYTEEELKAKVEAAGGTW